MSNYEEFPYAICDNNIHIIHHCSTIPRLKEALNEPLNAVSSFKKVYQNSPFLEIYNLR